MVFKASGNLDEQIADYLTAQIIRRELAPGQRIPESTLALELGVSRGPVREALRKLEPKGLVKLIPRRGARVTDLSPSYVDSLYDILIELYTLTARLAAQNRTKKDLVDFRRALRQIQDCAASGDVVAYYGAIFVFAGVGLRAAKNPLLEQLLRDFEPSTRRVQFASLARRADDLKKNVVFFEDAVRHVEERDAEIAAATIRTYAQNEKAFALKNTEPKSARREQAG